MIDLYPYQKDGVRYLRRGGLLLDDAGLGKTRQAIAAAVLGGRWPILVVCPSPLRIQWRDEILRVLPNDIVRVAGVGGRIDGNSVYDAHMRGLGLYYSDAAVRTRCWYIVHYEGLVNSLEDYEQISWETVIVDEAHYIKNKATKRTQAVELVTNIDSLRIALTATPFSSNPADVWSILSWTSPERFLEEYPSYWLFYGEHIISHTFTRRDGRSGRSVVGLRDEKAFSELLARYSLRRSKEQVAPDLPPLTESVVRLPLEGRQAKVYDVLKSETEVVIRNTLDEGAPASRVLSTTLARMHVCEQWCACPWILDPGVTGVKLSWLKEWIESNSLPAVIVTKYKATANKIAEMLQVRPVTGDLSAAKRALTISGWVDGDSLYLVGTIHTLGTGLNLQRAHTMLFVSDVYSPILMEQARNRIHRIVTDHPVQVIHLLVDRTSNNIVYRGYKERMKQLDVVRDFVQHCGGDETWLNAICVKEVDDALTATAQGIVPTVKGKGRRK